MNILFYYITTINPIKGGIARITAYLGKYLEKENHKVFYLSLTKENSQNTFTGKQLHLDPGNKKSIIQKKEAFKDIVNKYQIDLLIHQSATTPSQNFIINWAKENNIKIISVFHSSLYGIYGIKGRKCTKFIPPKAIDTLDHLSHVLFKFKYGTAYKELISKSDRVILLSDKFIDELKYFTNIKNTDKVLAIPNPLTVLSSTTIKKENILLFVGRLSASKQVHLLLKVWGKIHLKYPNWSLEIVGDGEERKKLENSSKKMKLTNIHFRGFQPPEPFYEKAKIFCMTSAHEGFGLVLVEGMANGVVPVAFNSYPNIVDIIDDNINGLLVSPFSINEYTIKTIELIENENKLNKMSNKAIAKSKSFQIESIGKTWLHVIKNL